MDDDQLDNLALQQMPSFLAENYRRLRESRNPQERVERALQVYTLTLRLLTILAVSQYLDRDRHDIRDPALNDVLKNRFRYLTLDGWKDVLFNALKAYEGNRDRFVVPELYDLYWSTATEPHTPRATVVEVFERLTSKAMAFSQGRELPKDKGEWQRLSRDLSEQVRDLLAEVAFLARYDLIRVTQRMDLTYDFDLHRGSTITHDQAPLPTGAKLDAGSFYLRSASGEFLLLHPLLVFWQPETTQTTPTVEVGIYDRFFYDQLRYFLAMSGELAFSTGTLRAFISLLYDTIERDKQSRMEAERLVWWQLSEICADITRRRMASVSGKYRADLYLQREKTAREFDAFLASPKRCFVLIGKSGVGKSNFLLALGEYLTHARNDVCLLMYDGAQLRADAPLSDAIAQDFDDKLVLSGRHVQGIWHEIARVDGIDQKKVILCVDAINENREATELLRQLDQLAQQPWPWLKIVFSSRPETWQAIKRGVKLAEALYYQESPDTLGVSLDPFSYSQSIESFSYSQRIDSFTRQELFEAYAKYAQVYRLQTPYEQLSADLREILREPLNLWLVAATYQGQPVPANLKVSSLVEQYLAALVRTARLQREDLRFLEKQLVPLLASADYYTNTITSQDLDRAGEGIYEAIYSEQRMSDGTQLNDSFRRLVDADILVRQELRRDERIAFKYERFYEYFVGSRIAALAQVQQDRNRYYVRMALQIPAHPYLWGAVRNALIAESARSGSALLVKLCFTEQQRVKELMVDTLTTLGVDQPRQVEPLLDHLVTRVRRSGRVGRVRRMIAQGRIRADMRTRNARTIAVEVASNLALPRILEAGARDRDPAVRTAAVRQSFQLWRRDRERGFEVLEQVAAQASPDIIPEAAALESAVGLSFVIFFDYAHDPKVLQRLQTIWRPAIGRLLGIQDSSRRLSTWMRTTIRQRIYSLAVSLAFRLLRDIGDTSPLTYGRIAAFFELPAEQKNLFRRLTGYLDVDGAYVSSDLQRDYREALRTRNVLISTVAGQGLSAHLERDPGGFLPVIKQLFAEVERDPIPSAWRSDITFAVMAVIEGNPSLDDVFDFFVHAAERCQTYYSEGDHASARYTTEPPETMYVGPYMACVYQRTGTVRTPWLEERIGAALARQQIPFFQSFFENDLGRVGIELRKPQAALDALALVFQRGNTQIDELAVTFLSRLRIHYPDEVDAFLEDQQAPEAIRLQVRRSMPTESIGSLIGFRASSFLLEDVLLGSADLRARYIALLAKAADSENMRAWIDHVVPAVVNVVYGGEALRPVR